MSGLAAWVDFGREDVVHPAIVREMSRRLRHRGPDGEGEWSAPHVAFAAQRLAAVDPAGSAQPAVAPDRAVLMLDGMIYNHEELRRDLHGRGHWYRGGGDAEVALAAYVEWGADFASRLEGMFAIVVWDPRREELLLVRDRLGVKPLCYTRRDAGLLVGSEPKALFAHPAVDPVVDADGLRELFAHGKLPGTTVFQDISEVRPGHCVRFGSRGLTQQRYWSLAAAEHRDDLPATVGTVRRLLTEAVSSHRRGDLPVDAMLSGGIDSSALTALAAREDAGLRSYSVNFAGYTENFQPHPTMRATPDAPFAAMVAEHVGTRHTEILVDLAELTDPGLHRAAMAAQDAPSPLGDMDASLLLFFRRLGEQGRRAVLSGETADEVFDGYFWAYDPEHSNSTTFPWVSFERGHDAAAGGLGCSLIDLSLRKELDFLGYADGHYRDALAEVSHLPGATAPERRAREVTYLALTRWAPTHLDRADRLSMAAGVQLRPPFCDHRLIEYVYNVPAAMKRAGGREKGLLREAVGDLLPGPVLERRKSAYPTIQEAAYGDAVRRRFAEVASDPGAAVAPLLDPAATTAALAAAAAPEGAFAWVERASMEMVLQLDTWLTDYAITLRV
ncbi:asparagine synthase (glutamine-hydrolyzing) [Actinoplanes octamycinicus]|uniref:asparagine synthase (glutamine-hydrolyzing) n=1 Tax=Actinoplanes octamycinicus TaxID=135948 RepID=A0A7W7H3H3_9ACTN|nr:asparagine synthase (glutamine-hydrolyzing) [Actinoplanes octamycinicus]MBB4743331.1 asparagine synthase (glutamine-hydrolyzing) [Actinoplanes octamycinicus]GIE61847.1 asparagine synthetase B [Actinoplanes octamycinicus]